MPASRDDILRHADELLAIGTYSDYGPNGLQVAGAAEVTKVASAVSCTLDVFRRAAAAGAQLLLVHHGMFWRGDSPVIDDARKARLAALFGADLTLAAYHLPLDGHERIGNNALLLRELDLRDTGERFGVAGGHPIGFVGEPEQPVGFGDFVARVGERLDRPPLALGAVPAEVRRVAICSGGAAKQLREAAALGADVFITGEPSEMAHAEATEAGVAFLAAGHYATETFGIRALGETLAGEFGLEHEFLPADNPV